MFSPQDFIVSQAIKSYGKPCFSACLQSSQVVDGGPSGPPFLLAILKAVEYPACSIQTWEQNGIIPSSKRDRRDV